MADRVEHAGIIAVDGATGYLGNHLVARLASCSLRVRAIVRSSSCPQDIAFLQATGAEVVAAELSQSSSILNKTLENVSTAVHLIGSIAPARGQSLEQLHARQTESLVKAAQLSGVSKIVMVTALGTGKDAASLYHRTKWQAEEILKESKLNYVILRPSLIVGRQVGRRDSKLVARYRQLIASRPTVPLIAGGKNLIQPVFVGDLVSCLVESATGARFDGETLEVGGSEVLTMREFVSKLMQVMGVVKPCIALPEFAARLLAIFAEAMMPVPLVSRDQVKLSLQDNVCLDNALQSKFKIAATPLETALEGYARESGPRQKVKL